MAIVIITDLLSRSPEVQCSVIQSSVATKCSVAEIVTTKVNLQGSTS